MKYLYVLISLISVNLSFADSPLTSTLFSEAYEDNEILIHVKEYGLDDFALNFLGNKRKDPVLKIAMINSLSFGNATYLQEFERYLLKNRKGLKPEVFDFLESKAASNTQKG